MTVDNIRHQLGLLLYGGPTREAMLLGYTEMAIARVCNYV